MKESLQFSLQSLSSQPIDVSKSLIIWRRGSGSNRRIKVLQTSPLPLGYRALERKYYFTEDEEASRQCIEWDQDFG